MVGAGSRTLKLVSSCIALINPSPIDPFDGVRPKTEQGGFFAHKCPTKAKTRVSLVMTFAGMPLTDIDASRSDHVVKFVELFWSQS
ncbi:hypothetical protein D3C76_1614720 [compost metagenome]